jgi:collagenase-like PrtC family protease
MLSRDCRSHYLHALRALRVDAVIVSDLGSRSAARYARFFTSLLGSPKRTENTFVYSA